MSTGKTQPATRHFTEKEAELAVNEYEVDRFEGDDRRWSRTVTTIVDLDGHYYAIPWEQGLTEYQESEYSAGDYPEVKRHVQVVAQSETSWPPVDAPDDDEQDHANIRDYVSMLSDDARVKLLSAVTASETGDYDGLQGIDATVGMSAMLDVVKRYQHLMTIFKDELSAKA
jgi:hypothetical protein